ncbi:MAG: alpha/beta hydrolase [Rhodocyclaceae bacterium]|nr:alpha/beta hydrolase [Rhodocyclaceae bacterium]
MAGTVVLGLVLALGLYGLMAAWLYANQARLLYFPVRELDADPAGIGLAFEAETIVTEDGVRLAAWFVPAKASAPVVLFCHGNAGNISHRLDSIALFHRLGLSVLIFDYRGYGESEGAPDEQGTYRDAHAAWRHLREARGVPADDIIVFGRSLGAAVAAWLAARERPRAVILESAFTSAAALGAEYYPWLPVDRLLRHRYDTLAQVAEVRAPLLVVHSRDDEIVPFHHALAVFDVAAEPKRLLEIRGGHNDGFLITGAPYRDALASFLAASGAARNPLPGDATGRP